ncbi:MAG: 4-hydroxy-3-methylbut-2-enyl diphosphate reductase [Roseomonas sp.]|nr:4-hydroxy-3-methylbut-2-enyl diphosphate reductase [Roseomonas sp.]
MHINLVGRGRYVALPPSAIADGSAVNPAWLAGVQTVGLTAGASAPEELILDVIAALRRHNDIEVSQLPGIREDIEFRLPPELRTSSSETSVPPAQ